jgi:group II intron reverse transcriptase/maturase
MELWDKFIDYNNLYLAWKKIRKNVSAPGIDGINVHQFNKDFKKNLNELKEEIQNLSYKSNIVKSGELYNKGKRRKIGILCTKDKIVQQAVLQVTDKIFEKNFSNSSYAYRHGISSIKAVDKIEKIIKNEPYKCGFFLKCDIENFFENVKHDMLIEFLKKKINDKNLLGFIEKLLVYSLKENNNIVIKKEGLCQGGIISPFLSNIYLDEFDKKIDQKGVLYFRYSDDILVFSENENKIKDLKHFIDNELRQLGLNLKYEKTVISNIDTGFKYPGFCFDSKGMKIPEESVKVLDEKIVREWNDTCNKSLNEKAKNIKAVIQGWEQYYGKVENYINIYHYLIDLLGCIENKDNEKISKIKKQRDNVICEDVEVAIELSEQWELLNEYKRSVEEYHKILNLSDIVNEDNIDKEFYDVIIEKLNLLLFYPENKELYDELIQMYTDVNEFIIAEELFNKKIDIVESNKEIKNFNISEDILQVSKNNEFKNNYNLNDSDINYFSNLFIGREEVHAINDKGTNKYSNVQSPITKELIKKHLKGDITLGSFIRSINNTVKYLVLDIDILKKILIEGKSEPDKIKNSLINTHRIALKIVLEAKKLGINAYIEDSGYRGRHVWIFFENWINAYKALDLGKILLNKIGKISEDINIEIFPSRGRIKAGKLGQLIKLPFGINAKSGRRGLFIDNDSNVYENQIDIIKSFKLNSVSTIRKIISINSKSNNKINNKNDEFRNIENRDIELLKPESDIVRNVLKKCSLMAYLCFKAKDTAYLSHYESTANAYEIFLKIKYFLLSYIS